MCGKSLEFEGTVRTSGIPPHGKFSVEIECDDGKRWVIGYDSDSPYCQFTDRRVAVSGRSYDPMDDDPIGQYRADQHLRVSRLRPVTPAGGDQLIEVGCGREFVGRFERRHYSPDRSTGEQSALMFVSDQDEAFRLARFPEEVEADRRVKVLAYYVEPSTPVTDSPNQHLWISWVGEPDVS
jgi:hypothetical protein